jgi:hypothetical protein
MTPCVSEWQAIGASDTIITWITQGVSLAFFDSSPDFCLSNHKLTPTQTKFVDNEITALLQCGAIACSIKQPRCVSPLGVVPKKNNKLRLISDLRQLNCDVPKFRYEDISTALELVQPHDNFITADLQNGFLHLFCHHTKRSLVSAGEPSFTFGVHSRLARKDLHITSIKLCELLCHFYDNMACGSPPM